MDGSNVDLCQKSRAEPQLETLWLSCDIHLNVLVPEVLGTFYFGGSRGS